MVGGLFGVHNIDMGMCSSFARVFDIRKKKSFFFFYIIFYGMVVVELSHFFHSRSSIVFTMFFYFFSFFFCIAWPLLSCKVGMAGHMCALGIS